MSLSLFQHYEICSNPILAVTRHFDKRHLGTNFAFFGQIALCTVEHEGLVFITRVHDGGHASSDLNDFALKTAIGVTHFFFKKT